MPEPTPTLTFSEIRRNFDLLFPEFVPPPPNPKVESVAEVPLSEWVLPLVPLLFLLPLLFLFFHFTPSERTQRRKDDSSSEAGGMAPREVQPAAVSLPIAAPRAGGFMRQVLRVFVPAATLAAGLFLLAGSYHPRRHEPIDAAPFAIGAVVSIVGAAFLFRALRETASR